VDQKEYNKPHCGVAVIRVVDMWRKQPKSNPAANLARTKSEMSMVSPPRGKDLERTMALSLKDLPESPQKEVRAKSWCFTSLYLLSHNTQDCDGGLGGAAEDY
jgi:hypothetical protein